MLADRMSKINSSGIRKVFDLAQKIKNPVNLSIGQPDFDIPDPVKAEAEKWIYAGFNRYTQTQGIPELIAGVRAKLDAKHPAGKFEDIIITSGTSGGLLLAFMALINPGDEVLIPDPYFVMYKHLVNLLGGVPVYVDTYPDFKLDPEKFEAAITPKTKLMLLNSPTNPTGVVCGEAELKDVAEVAKKHNLFIITDEIYESFAYDAAAPSICSFYDNVLLLNGFSKSHSMTGWRIGYAAGPKFLIQEMAKLQQYSFVCAPSFAQKAAVKALENEDMGVHFSDYKRKRDLIYNGIKDKYEVVRPGGAFYMFPAAPGGNATEFVTRAIENNLLIIPGNVFSERDTHFRLSFAATDETIEKGIEILNRIA